MIKIYHNPRCSKSRQALQRLKTSKVEYEIIDYTKTPFTEDVLNKLIKKIGIQAHQLIRTNESIYKDNCKGKNVSNEECVKAMVQYYKLIQRPILEKYENAVIGRSDEIVDQFISS